MSTNMVHNYSQDKSETPQAKEPELQYETLETNTEELLLSPDYPRTISEEEIAQAFTLEEFKQHMNDLVESTHNHATGCVEETPIIPRVYSIKEAQRRSMTVEQFTSKLYAMVDEFYSKKA